MLYLIYGEHTPPRQKELLRITTLFPAYEKVTIGEGSLGEEVLGNLALSGGLFGTKTLAVLEFTLGFESAETIVLRHLKELQQSETIFILYERTLRKDILATLTTHAQEVFDSGSLGKKIPLLPFSFIDHFAARDKFKLWAGYREALTRGIVLREYHGALVWLVKTLYLVKTNPNTDAKELGIAPTSYSKAKRAVGKFTERELHGWYRALVNMVHDGSRMEYLETDLEALLLSFEAGK
jgi:hypothetical protein